MRISFVQAYVKTYVTVDYNFSVNLYVRGILHPKILSWRERIYECFWNHIPKYCFKWAVASGKWFFNWEQSQEPRAILIVWMRSPLWFRCSRVSSWRISSFSSSYDDLRWTSSKLKICWPNYMSESQKKTNINDRWSSEKFGVVLLKIQRRRYVW